MSLSIMINQTPEDINIISSIKNYLLHFDQIFYQQNKYSYQDNKSNQVPLEDIIKWLNNILLVLDDPEFGQEELYNPLELSS